MTKSLLEDILERLHATEQELENEFERLLEEKRERFHYTLRRGKVVFERGVQSLQRQHRIGVWRYFRQAPIVYILSAPMIYGMIVPLVILDASVTLYQHICFRIYGISRVRRGDYLIIDRHH